MPRVALLATAVATLIATIVVGTVPADAATPDDREAALAAEYLVELNLERAARGLAPLRLDPDVGRAAQDWSERMARRGVLAHSDDPRAEIVGRGQRTGQITALWMDSPGHRHLVVDPNLGWAGVGVACDGRGDMWAVVQFRRIDTSRGTLRSSSASPQVVAPSVGTTCGDGVPTSMVNSIRRLYAAFFLRQPDRSGLAYWTGEAGVGQTLETMAEAFTASAEFRDTYGHLGDRAFVDLVYQNVMGRGADAGGYHYWVTMLRRGLERGEMMVQFSESAEFRAVTGID